MVPSLEKLESRTSGVRMGLSVSTPKRDQVPLEQKAKLPLWPLNSSAQRLPARAIPRQMKIARSMRVSRLSGRRAMMTTTMPMRLSMMPQISMLTLSNITGFSTK